MLLPFEIFYLAVPLKNSRSSQRNSHQTSDKVNHYIAMKVKYQLYVIYLNISVGYYWHTIQKYKHERHANAVFLTANVTQWKQVTTSTYFPSLHYFSILHYAWINSGKTHQQNSVNWSDSLDLHAKSIWIYSLWLLTQCIKAWVIHSPGDPISAKTISV